MSPSLPEGGVEQEGEREEDGHWKSSESEAVWALALTALLSVFSHRACLCLLESPLQSKPHRSGRTLADPDFWLSKRRT